MAAPALTEATCRDAITQLCQTDPGLDAMVRRWGAPPLWPHPTGFPGLLLAILAQQVSLESAHACYVKLNLEIGLVRPEAFLRLDDATLRRVGFSRQKSGYARQLADSMVEGRLDLDALRDLADEAARARLMRLRGVGRWTADTYLLFSLLRPDAWPSGDLALQRVMAHPDGSAAPLSAADADRIALRWQPWRAVAARILWSQYLHVRGRFDAVSALWSSLGE